VSECLQNNARCRWCGAAESVLIETAAGFDDQTEVFSLRRCSGCGLVRTEPFLTGRQLSRYYTQSYYGQFSTKFSDTF
jgi:uncharacterized Zn finger protein